MCAQKVPGVLISKINLNSVFAPFCCFLMSQVFQITCKISFKLPLWHMIFDSFDYNTDVPFVTSSNYLFLVYWYYILVLLLSFFLSCRWPFWLILAYKDSLLWCYDLRRNSSQELQNSDENWQRNARFSTIEYFGFLKKVLQYGKTFCYSYRCRKWITTTAIATGYV